jgi:carbon-monoxide dehydrogenase large subunit
MATAGSILGNAVLRLEDPTLLTGEGKYVDDLIEPGMLHVAFARSTIAHGDLVAVDVSEAAAMPGVVAVYHSGGEDLGLASLQQFPMMPESLNRPIFATGGCASSATSLPPRGRDRARRPTPPSVS